jgi:hypothetical protein
VFVGPLLKRNRKWAHFVEWGGYPGVILPGYWI